MNTQQSNSSHTDHFLNLPWFVNGTLPDHLKQQVRAHIEECLICQQEVDVLKRTQRVVTNDLQEGQPDEKRLDSLMTRIEQATVHPDKSVKPINVLDNLRSFFSGLFENKLVWATAAPVVLLAVLLMRNPGIDNETPEYKTLSSGEQTAEDTIFLDFVAGNNLDSENILVDIKLMFPGTNLKAESDGHYVLAIPGNVTPEEVLKVMKMLQAYPSVSSVQRITK